MSTTYPIVYLEPPRVRPFPPEAGIWRMRAEDARKLMDWYFDAFYPKSSADQP